MICDAYDEKIKKTEENTEDEGEPSSEEVFPFMVFYLPLWISITLYGISFALYGISITLYGYFNYLILLSTSLFIIFDTYLLLLL